MEFQNFETQHLNTYNCSESRENHIILRDKLYMAVIKAPHMLTNYTLLLKRCWEEYNLVYCILTALTEGYIARIFWRTD